MLYHSIIAIFFLLHFFFHSIKLQLDLVVFVDFGSQCLSPFYHFSLGKFCYKLKSLQQLFCSYMNFDNFLTNCESIKLELFFS